MLTSFHLVCLKQVNRQNSRFLTEIKDKKTGIWSFLAKKGEKHGKRCRMRIVKLYGTIRS